MTLKLKVACPECGGECWTTICDCDPDRVHHCKGQGTCGTSPCEWCDGSGEEVVDLTPEAFIQALYAEGGGLRAISPDLMIGLEEVINDIVPGPLDADRVAEWIKWAGEEDCKTVKLALAGAKPGPRKQLFETLLVHELFLWQNRAKSLIRNIYDKADPPVRDLVRESTLIEEVPDLSIRPVVDLGEMSREELEKLVSDLQAVIVVKDVGLRKQHPLYDAPIREKARQWALNATPEMAQGIAERLEEQVKELKNEAWSWEAAYRHNNRESQILRKALHERLDIFERAFRKANRMKRELKRKLAGR
jgi:hypothetical protein